MTFNSSILPRGLAAFIVIALLSAAGCGPSKTTFKSSDSVSYIPTVTGNLGECTRINGVYVQGQLGTFRNANRALVPDYINMNLTSVPTTVFTTSTMSIYFLRWYEKTAGSKVVNQVPTRFYFVDKLTGLTYPQNTTIDRVTKANLELARTRFAWTTVTLAQFFERAMIVLTGVDMTFDAISVQLLDTSFGASPYAQTDALLPSILANPSLYQQEMPVPSLVALHPNYSLLNSAATETDFRQNIEVICNQLAGIGSRIPASADGAKKVTPAKLTAGLSSTPAAYLGDATTPQDLKARSLASTSGGAKSQTETSLFGRIWSRILETFN